MADMPTKAKRHTLDDHMFGDFYTHDHDGDADHDHDDMDPGPLEDNPIWQRDNVALSSVGIDIGSAGTQVVFSNIHLQRLNTSHASRYVIVDRATAYESPVSFTPFRDARTIDSGALGAIIDRAYADAQVQPADIDTGVVILTGEALRRENAENIASLLAEKGGEFVTATAGNHMEAMLAAYGSGAAKTSHDTGQRILNIDMGGGTTKLALLERGEVTWTGALHIGGRLIVVADNIVRRLDPAGAHHAMKAGRDLKLGTPADETDLAAIADGMVDLLIRAVTEQPACQAVLEILLTDPPESFGRLDGLMFSGGVAEYVYEREVRDFGDLGIQLGRFIRKRMGAGDFGAPLLPAGACIRATALGASEYSVQLSGQTSTITAPGKVLPRRNMQVLKPTLDFSSNPDAGEIAQRIRTHFEAFDLDPAEDPVALAFDWHGAPEYGRIRALADGIADALNTYIRNDGTLYVMIDGDIALTLGGVMRDELGLRNDMLVVDGVTLRDFDYIDLGKIRLPSFTVPVTVKSLLFRDDPRGPQRQERIQFHAHGHHHHDQETPNPESHQ